MNRVTLPDVEQTHELSLQLYGATREEHTVILGHFMRYLRSRSRMSTREVADKVGRSVSFVGMLERGERHFTPELLATMCRACKVKYKVSKDKTETTIRFATDDGESILAVIFEPSPDIIFINDSGSEMSEEQAAKMAGLMKLFVTKPWTIDQAYYAVTGAES